MRDERKKAVDIFQPFYIVFYVHILNAQSPILISFFLCYNDYETDLLNCRRRTVENDTAQRKS